MEIPHLECKRCGHTWIPRSDKLPLNCPKPTCRSPYWNKERKLIYNEKPKENKRIVKSNSG